MGSNTMSSTPIPQLRPRRVRQQAADAVGLMLFSAAMSVGVTALLVLLTHLGR